MIRKLVIMIFSTMTLFFFVLSIQRLRMDYNEEGVYFDGVTTYDSDAVVAYISLTIVSLIMAIILISIKFKPS